MLSLKLSIQLILITLLGIYARRRNIVDSKFDEQLSNFIVQVALPLMIVNSLQAKFSIERLKQCGQLLLLSLLMMALTFLLGQIFYLALGKGTTGRITRFVAVFMNFTVVGIPVIDMLYGADALFLFMVYIVPLRIFYYSSAKVLLAPPELEPIKTSWRKRLAFWFPPPVLAVIVGLLLFVLKIQIPAFLREVMSSVGGVCSPLGMVICGLCIGKYQFREFLRGPAVLFAVVRDLICPAITLCVCFVLHVPMELTQIAVICSALPAGVLISSFIVKYNCGDEAKKESAGAVVASSVLSSVTIPLWTYVLTCVQPFFP